MIDIHAPAGMSRKDPGVYEIVNRENNKRYVGSTFRPITKRVRDHQNYLEIQKHSNAHLQNSYNKYGKDSFVVWILGIEEDKESLRELEYNWMSSRRQQGYELYNIKRPEEERPNLWTFTEEYRQEKRKFMEEKWKEEEYRQKVMKGIERSNTEEVRAYRTRQRSLSIISEHVGKKLVDPNGEVVEFPENTTYDEFVEEHDITKIELRDILLEITFNSGGWTLLKNNPEKEPNRQKPTYDQECRLINTITKETVTGQSSKELSERSGLERQKCSKLKNGLVTITEESWMKVPDGGIGELDWIEVVNEETGQEVRAMKNKDIAKLTSMNKHQVSFLTRGITNSSECGWKLKE